MYIQYIHKNGLFVLNALVNETHFSLPLVDFRFGEAKQNH